MHSCGCLGRAGGRQTVASRPRAAHSATALALPPAACRVLERALITSCWPCASSVQGGELAAASKGSDRIRGVRSALAGERRAQDALQAAPTPKPYSRLPSCLSPSHTTMMHLTAALLALALASVSAQAPTKVGVVNLSPLASRQADGSLTGEQEDLGSAQQAGPPAADGRPPNAADRRRRPPTHVPPAPTGLGALPAPAPLRRVPHRSRRVGLLSSPTPNKQASMPPWLRRPASWRACSATWS